MQIEKEREDLQKQISESDKRIIDLENQIIELNKIRQQDRHFALHRVLEEYRIFFLQVSKADYFFVGGASILFMWSIKFGPGIGIKFFWILGLAWAFQFNALICGGLQIEKSLDFSRQWLDFIIEFLKPPSDNPEEWEETVKEKFSSAFNVDKKTLRFRERFFLSLGIGYLCIVVFAYLNLF